jgi:hypothetical protein
VDPVEREAVVVDPVEREVAGPITSLGTLAEAAEVKMAARAEREAIFQGMAQVVVVVTVRDLMAEMRAVTAASQLSTH